MNHLEHIWVSIDELEVGANPKVSQYLNWDIYAETWKLVDAGAKIRNLPLYHALTKYYSERDLGRREYEAKLLGIKSTKGSDIAFKWLQIHIKLFNDIKRSGFKPELRNKPLSLRINDKGRLRIVDGHHTVSILKYLGYKKKLEFTVVERDKKWLQLKQKLYDMYKQKLLYQPVYHPDFDDWKIDRGCLDRWNIIKQHVENVKGKRVLDIGSNMGYFCERFTDLGARVVGIDPNPVRVQASRMFSEYHGYTEPPLYYCEKFEEHLEDEDYDLVLLLSLIHHYIRRNPDEAWKALKLISEHCDKMILELGVNRLPLVWKPELVLKHSEYTKYTTLYDGERPIYLYEKS